MERTCKECGEPKSFIKAFASLQDGGRSTVCKDCETKGVIHEANLRLKKKKADGALDETKKDERICDKCEETKDLEKGFQRVRGGGRSRTCKTCHAEKVLAGIKKKAILEKYPLRSYGTPPDTKPEPEKPQDIEQDNPVEENTPPDPPPAKEASGAGNGAKILQVDFAEHPDVYDALISLAADKLRTPEKQVIWALKAAIDSGEKLLAAEGV